MSINAPVSFAAINYSSNDCSIIARPMAQVVSTQIHYTHMNALITVHCETFYGKICFGTGDRHAAYNVIGLLQ